VIFPNPQSDTAQELTRLEQEVVQRRKQLRDVELERSQATTRVRSLKEQLTEAYAADKSPAKLKTKHAEALRVLKEDMPPQVEGAKRALDRATAAVTSYMGEHFEDLAAEMLPACLAARDDIQQAIDDLEAAQGRWIGEAQRFDKLRQTAPEARGLQMPELRLGKLDSAIADIDGQVPVPMPRQLVPEDARDEAEGTET